MFILYFTHPHLLNENKLRTHTLQARCGTFTLLPTPNSQLPTPNVTTQVVWCPKKWIGWVLIMGGMMLSVRTNLAHKRHKFPAISWLQNLNLSFPQRKFPFFLGLSQRPAPAGHATCARGSHDLRPQVTRPAPAGRWESAEVKREQALESLHPVTAQVATEKTKTMINPLNRLGASPWC